MVLSVRVKLWSTGTRCWTLESAAGAAYLSNLDSGQNWYTADGEPTRALARPMNIISSRNIRWYPRFRDYGAGFTLAAPYWIPAAAIASLYLLVPWVRPGRRCCLECGYSLVGLTGAVCPECGAKFERQGTNETSRSEPEPPSPPGVSEVCVGACEMDDPTAARNATT